VENHNSLADTIKANNAQISRCFNQINKSFTQMELRLDTCKEEVGELCAALDLFSTRLGMLEEASTKKDECQGGPWRSPEIQSTLVWSLCWGATGGAGRSTQRGEQRRFVRTRGNKGEVGVTRDQCRVW